MRRIALGSWSLAVDVHRVAPPLPWWTWAGAALTFAGAYQVCAALVGWA